MSAHYFAEYISSEQAYEINKEYGYSLGVWRSRAKAHGKCESCRSAPIWRYGGNGLCFSCHTGEWDASDDYELIQE